MLPTATATATAAQLSPCGGGSICIFAAWQQRRATPMPKGFREGFANGAGRGGGQVHGLRLELGLGLA